jgi:TonB-linked SusC/RagA family outer membrane protein
MQFSFAQEKTVTGVVSDNTGVLPGANVVVKGTKRGTQTDVDGKFSIKAKAGDVLVISYVGANETSVTVGSSSTYNVKLSQGKELDVVVVSGSLGIKKRKDALTSSQQVVGNKELTQASNPSVVQSLTGKVSGLQINTTDGGVNASTRIVLRGNRSITSNNEALIVIDNVISSATILAQLPPEVVENVNVIKGMQGAALYGQQGVNGVIMVTTKKGGKGDKANISLSTSIDFETVAYLPQTQQRYGQGWAIQDHFSHVTYENGSWGPEYDGTLQPVGLPRADGTYLIAPYSPIKDNVKKFFNTGTILQNGFSISGGNADKGYYNFSANRQTSDYVVQGDQLKRNSFIFKGGKKFGKLSIDGNVNYIGQKTSQTDAGLYEELLQTAGNIPVQEFSNVNGNNHWTAYYVSPYWKRDNIRYDNSRDYMSGIATLGYEINKHINVSYVANLQFTQANGDHHTNAYVDLVGPGLGGSDRSIASEYYTNNSNSRNYYGDLLVNFNYNLNKDLELKFNLGNNVQDRLSKITSAGGTNLAVPGLYTITNVLNPALPSTLDTGLGNSSSTGAGNSSTRYRSFAYFANIDLDYKHYLFLNLTGRNDHTSNLSADNNSYFYPSAGLSFVPTKAIEFLKDNSVLNYAKISASYVKVGNAQGVGTYAINNIMNLATGYPFNGGSNSYSINQNPTDPKIRPEFLSTKELTINLGFLKDRITFDGSIFKTTTTDLITRVSTSSASGLATNAINIGAMDTKGLELDLGIVPIKTKDFTWTSRFSYSKAKSIVTKVSDQSNSVALLTNANIPTNAVFGIYAEVGEEFPLIKGTKYQRDDQGHVIIDPTTGNPLTTSTLEKLGKSTPDYTLGFNNSFDYKGLRLTVVCDYRTGNKFYSDVKYNYAWTGRLVESAENGRTGFIYPNSVIPNSSNTGYVTNTSVVTAGGSNSDYVNYYDKYSRVGENFILDGTAFKVRELSLSYALPSKYLDRTGLTSVRFGVNARNPFTFLPRENRGYNDPETSISSTSNAQGAATAGQYPPTKTYGFSLNLTF